MSRFWLGPTGGILLNIVGGLLTIPATAVFALAWRKLSRLGFKKVFGPAVTSRSLIYGSLALVPQGTNKFQFIKSTQPGYAYSATSVASGCEVRAISYLATVLRLNGNIKSEIADDFQLAGKLDIDFVAFGCMNNKKSQDILGNSANKFVRYDVVSNAYVDLNGKGLYGGRHDYGVLLKIHPHQFPDRVWIGCLGLGEWGTSGTAWFLANKWRQLASKLEADNHDFMAIIEVVSGQDESATLISVVK
jgi:hypothetical protein